VAQKCITFVIFKITAQSKQSPIGRKFAQSGHLDDFPNVGEKLKKKLKPIARKVKQSN
jgi:hypothetical protein